MWRASGKRGGRAGRSACTECGKGKGCLERGACSAARTAEGMLFLASTWVRETKCVRGGVGWRQCGSCRSRVEVRVAVLKACVQFRKHKRLVAAHSSAAPTQSRIAPSEQLTLYATSKRCCPLPQLHGSGLFVLPQPSHICVLRVAGRGRLCTMVSGGGTSHSDPWPEPKPPPQSSSKPSCDLSCAALVI